MWVSQYWVPLFYQRRNSLLQMAASLSCLPSLALPSPDIQVWMLKSNRTLDQVSLPPLLRVQATSHILVPPAPHGMSNKLNFMRMRLPTQYGCCELLPIGTRLL